MEKLHRATEDYLKTIYLLGGDHMGVRCVDVASRLGISRPSVSVTVKRLTDNGFLEIDGHHQLRLTDRGVQVARSTLEKNQAIRTMLQAFGVDEENAARDACRMEHDISPVSLAAMQSWWRENGKHGEEEQAQ